MSPEQQAYSIVFRSPWQSWCLRMRQPAAYRARTACYLCSMTRPIELSASIRCLTKNTHKECNKLISPKKKYNNDKYCREVIISCISNSTFGDTRKSDYSGTRFYKKPSISCTDLSFNEQRGCLDKSSNFSLM